MEKCKRMKRQLCMSKNWIYSWQWKYSKTRQQDCRSESFAMTTDFLVTGSMVKNTSHQKEFGYPATRRTSFLLWLLACQIRLQDLILQLQGHLQDKWVIAQRLLRARLPHLQRVKFRLENERIELRVTSLSSNCVKYGWLEIVATLYWPSQKKSKNKCLGTLDGTRRPVVYRLSLCNLWNAGVAARIQENMVDDEKPLQGSSHASSSHEASLEPTTERREDLGKLSVCTHFPKDRNCEICKKDRNYKGPMQKTQWRSRTSCWKILVTWKQQITKSSVTIANLETITDMQSWCRTLSLNGSKHIRATVLGAPWEA